LNIAFILAYYQNIVIGLQGQINILGFKIGSVSTMGGKEKLSS